MWNCRISPRMMSLCAVSCLYNQKVAELTKKTQKHQPCASVKLSLCCQGACCGSRKSWHITLPYRGVACFKWQLGVKKFLQFLSWSGNLIFTTIAAAACICCLIINVAKYWMGMRIFSTNWFWSNKLLWNCSVQLSSGFVAIACFLATASKPHPALVFFRCASWRSGWV